MVGQNNKKPDHRPLIPNGLYAAYKILKLPIPKPRNRQVRFPPSRYPFAMLMEPGDCFPLLVTDDPQEVRVASERYGNRHRMRFVVRSDKCGGYICWRVE